MESSIRKRIKEIKKEIQSLEIIRPGKITKQKRGSKEERYNYNYLSYTFQNKGYTEYIKEKYIERVIRETDNFRKFKELSDEWIELSIKLSKLEMKS